MDGVTVISLITQTIQLFEHPLFQEKWLIVFQAFHTPTLEIIIPISEHLQARSGVAECLQELDSACVTQWGLPNVYYPSTVSAELERGLLNIL